MPRRVIDLLASLCHTSFLLVLFSRFSQRRPPGQYRKDEHGQKCESQRRGRHGISIAPHGYEESRNGCGAQGDDQGE